MRAARWVAAFDSATAMLRALGSYLHGRDFPALGILPSFTPVEKLADLVAKLPPSLLDAIYTYAGGFEAVSARELEDVRAEEISRWIVSQYPARPYPAIAIGSSNGALVHLWAALGIPWLPQTVLIPFEQRGVEPDQGKLDLMKALPHGQALLEANPELALHHMHDPNQDRLMIRRMTYFRVKRLVLGRAFEEFIARWLAPGGTLFLVDCDLAWPSVQVSDRYFFQLGAPGGATKEEYVRGGPRVAEFLARQGSVRRRFGFPDPDGESPEAEWGLEPALGRDVLRFARERGYRVRRVRHAHPEDASPFVADLHRAWYRLRGHAPSRLLVESFVLLEPYWCLATGSVPFWTMFSVERSVAAVKRYLDRVEPFDEVNAFVFQHGVESVGLAKAADWRRVLARGRRGGRFLGLDEKQHPKDFATFLRYHSALSNLGPRYPLPGYLGLDELDRFIALRPPDALRFEEVEPPAKAREARGLAA